MMSFFDPFVIDMSPGSSIDMPIINREFDRAKIKVISSGKRTVRVINRVRETVGD